MPRPRPARVGTIARHPRSRGSSWLRRSWVAVIETQAEAFRHAAIWAHITGSIRRDSGRAPGQTVILYDGGRVVGSATVDRSGRTATARC